MERAFLDQYAVTLNNENLNLIQPFHPEVDQAFLDKYGVTLNNAILCEEKHLPGTNSEKVTFTVTF